MGQEPDRKFFVFFRLCVEISVLFCLGYWCYAFCCGKYVMMRQQQAISIITANMKKNYAESEFYPEAETLKDKNIAPQDMALNGEEYYWKHYFGGNMIISGTKETPPNKYNIIFNKLKQSDCILMATANWEKNEDFIGVTAYKYGVIAKNANLPVYDLKKNINAKDAEKMCDCKEDKTCSVVLVYK